MNFLRMLKAKALGNSLSETDNGFTINNKKHDTQVSISLLIMMSLNCILRSQCIAFSGNL